MKPIKQKYWAVFSGKCEHWDGIHADLAAAKAELNFYQFYIPNGEWGLFELTAEEITKFENDYPHMDEIIKVVRFMPEPANKLRYYKGLIFNSNFQDSE